MRIKSKYIKYKDVCIIIINTKYIILRIHKYLKYNYIF